MTFEIFAFFVFIELNLLIHWNADRITAKEEPGN